VVEEITLQVLFPNLTDVRFFMGLIDLLVHGYEIFQNIEGEEDVKENQQVIL
jgi:hypothetical protein